MEDMIELPQKRDLLAKFMLTEVRPEFYLLIDVKNTNIFSYLKTITL